MVMLESRRDCICPLCVPSCPMVLSCGVLPSLKTCFLEKVQWRASKYILSDYQSDYKTRLTKLAIMPLMMYFEVI